MSCCTGHTVSTILAMDFAGEDWEEIESVAELAHCRLEARLKEVLRKREN